MTTQLQVTDVLSTFNQEGEPVEFYFSLYMTGHWTGLVAGVEGGYCKPWEEFIKDYTEYAHLTPPPTFHEQNG